jgi:hypothetical protein
MAPVGPSKGLWSQIAALLVLSIGVSFANLEVREFVWDDTYLVEENPALADPGNLPRYFAHPWAWGTESSLGATKNRAYYRPLAMVSLALDRMLWGPSPTGFRVTNDVLHAAVALLLFLLCRRLGAAAIPAWLAAALFAVHPVATEVTAISAYRTESLSALFILLALYVAVGRGRPLVQAPAVFCLATCAALCKESSVVLLLLLPLVRKAADVSASGPTALPRSAPAWLLLAVAAAALGSVLAVRSFVTSPVAGAVTGHLTLFDRLLLAPKLVFLYVATYVVPYPLSAHYDLSLVAIPSELGEPAVLAGLALLAGCAALQPLLLRRGIREALLLLGFLAALLPVLHLVPFRVLFAARFLYLPSLFVLAALALAATRLRPPSKAAGGLLIVAAAGVVALYASLSVVRYPDFRDTQSMMEAEVRHFPAGFDAHFSYSQHLAETGRREEALQEVEEALRIWPGFPPALRLREDLLKAGVGQEGDGQGGR